MRFPKNLLVAYRGGGYDGNFWEWNLFMFDSNREFVDIYSSGFAGITDPKVAYQLYCDIKAGHEHLGSEHRITAYSQMHKFQATYNPGLVKSVVKAIWEHYQNSPDFNKVRAHICCDLCGGEIYDLDEIAFVNYRSDHVLGRCSGPIAPRTKICWECFSQGRCEQCWEEKEDVEDAYCPDEVEKYGMCEWHHRRVIITVLRERRGNPADPNGHKLIQMFAPVFIGEEQMKRLVLVAPAIASRQRPVFETNIKTISERVVKCYNALSEAEQHEAVLPPVSTPKTHDTPLFAVCGLSV